MNVQAELLNALVITKYHPLKLAYLVQLAGENQFAISQGFDVEEALKLCEFVQAHPVIKPMAVDFKKVVW